MMRDDVNGVASLGDWGTVMNPLTGLPVLMMMMMMMMIMIVISLETSEHPGGFDQCDHRSKPGREPCCVLQASEFILG